MNNPTPPKGALPKYVQISELLIRDIAAGRLIDGERLEPERNMAVTLGTSVGTLRKALNMLEQKGLLERIHGSGNYVRHNPASDSIYAMFRLELPQGGGLPRAEAFDVRYMVKADLPNFGTSNRGTRVRRIRRLNETVIALEEIWLDGDTGRIDPNQLSDSLYQYYQHHLEVWITRAEDSVSIAPLPDWAPDGFHLHAGHMMGYIERFSWADHPTPVEYSRTWFDSTRARYVQRFR